MKKEAKVEKEKEGGEKGKGGNGETLRKWEEKKVKAKFSMVGKPLSATS